MAKTTKKSKTGKSKAKLALGITVVIMALFAVGYFVYFSGIVPQLLTGMTITETKADGTTAKVADLSVLETNYYYMSIYSMYAQYGMINSDNLDKVVNESTGQTYRELLLSQGADEAMNLILMEREAESKGFRQLSQASRCAKMEVESLRGMAKLYGYNTVDRYIAAQYGTGMTSRIYRKCIERGLFTEEYQAYLSQFDNTIAPSDEAVKEQYKADPSKFEKVTFNYYLIVAQNDKDGKLDIAAAKKDAQWISDKATDAKTFRSTVMTYLKGKNDTESLAKYENDADPTLIEDLTKTNVESYYDKNLAEYLFASDRKAGDKTVIETNTGAYVVMFGERKLDEEQAVTYRTLTLQNDAKNGKVRTNEEIAADAKALADKAAQLCPQGLDPLSFYKVAKENTADQDEMLSGGYTAGETKADMLEGDNGKEATAEQKALAEWLFDASRKQGDIRIVTSEDNRTVTVYYFEKTTASWIVDAKNDQTTENINKLKESLKSTKPQYVINSDLIKNFIYNVNG